MDLFLFTMQQLAPALGMLRARGLQPIRSYLADWLHLHHPQPEPPALRNGTQLGEELGLNEQQRIRLMFDLEDKYGVNFPDEEVPVLLTVQEVEASLMRQCTKRAA